MDNEKLENFISYYEQHYKPLLHSISVEEILFIGEEERRLLSFLKSDIEELLGIKEVD